MVTMSDPAADAMLKVSQIAIGRRTTDGMDGMDGLHALQQRSVNEVSPWLIQDHFIVFYPQEMENGD
jgi:hypothetical protein